MILLLLLISSGSVLPQCMEELYPDRIPKSSCTNASGYWFDWIVAIKPKECYQVLTAVTVHYYGQSGDYCCSDKSQKCCRGYKQMKKTLPNDTTPFMLPLFEELPVQGTPSKLISVNYYL